MFGGMFAEKAVFLDYLSIYMYYLHGKNIKSLVKLRFC